MISVVMGLNRYDLYVLDAVNSILAQSFKDFEFIIVANGICCHEIENQLLQKYPTEKRLKIIKSQIPQLAYALNVGIENSSYKYLARMDSDDVAWPNRLEKQFAYLTQNNLDLVGCDLRLIDAVGHILGTRTYPKGESINRCLPFKNCFAHNTIMVKRDILVAARGYNAGFNTEDYDLWLRLLRIGIKWDNMNETLLDYRIHDAASQRRLLGYAEATALAMREFVLKKTVVNLLAVGYHFVKSLLRARD